MRIDNLSEQQLENIFNNLNKYVNTNYQQVWTRYVKLGSKTVRIICYSDEFTPLVERQLTFTLSDCADSYDSTLVIWKEKNIFAVPKMLDSVFDPKVNIRLRIDMLYSKTKEPEIYVFNNEFSVHNPVIYTDNNSRIFNAYDTRNNIQYYGVENLEPEEFIKQGHIFVQQFNKIIKSDNANLVHGAVIGLNNNGILFCARGQRGKSTLSVLSMMEGFEYVSDDYLILEKEGENLFSYPIYSIITLSPRMYNELYDKLEGCRFVSNNARKDKYVVNIAKYHNLFRNKYPIKICMFPEIVSDKNPSIEPCPKGRAITQLIQSSVFQTQDMNDNKTIKKLLDMISGFEFYKINLCNDIKKNTEFLREFMNDFENRSHKIFEEDKMYEDITFDLANILDSENGVIYSMNKFATNVYENLKSGVAYEVISEKLKSFAGMPDDIENNLKMFVDALLAEGILKSLKKTSSDVHLNVNFARDDKFKLSCIKYMETESVELVKEIKKENKNELCIK